MEESQNNENILQLHCILLKPCNVYCLLALIWYRIYSIKSPYILFKTHKIWYKFSLTNMFLSCPVLYRISGKYRLPASVKCVCLKNPAKSMVRIIRDYSIIWTTAFAHWRCCLYLDLVILLVHEWANRSCNTSCDMLGNQSLDLLDFLLEGQEGPSYPIVFLLLSTTATAVSVLGRSHLTFSGNHDLNHCSLLIPNMTCQCVVVALIVLCKVRGYVQDLNTTLINHAVR